MNAIEILKHEHQIILQVLAEAQRQAQAIQDHGNLDADKIGQMVDFFTVFVERCHNAKEEEYLFPRLEELGVPASHGVLAVMLQEHAMGRKKVKDLAAALAKAKEGAAAFLPAVAAHLSSYADLLTSHIEKEDTVLFPMAYRLLTARDQEMMVNSFDKHEAEEMGVGVHEKYYQLAEKLTPGH